MMISSVGNVNAMSAQEMIAGGMEGAMMKQNARSGVAPSAFTRRELLHTVSAGFGWQASRNVAASVS